MLTIIRFSPERHHRAAEKTEKKQAQFKDFLCVSVVQAFPCQKAKAAIFAIAAVG